MSLQRNPTKRGVLMLRNPSARGSNWEYAQHEKLLRYIDGAGANVVESEAQFYLPWITPRRGFDELERGAHHPELRRGWITPRRGRSELERGAHHQKLRQADEAVRVDQVSDLSSITVQCELGKGRIRKPVEMDAPLWNEAKKVLAANGVEKDKSSRSFYTDKFTGACVFMRQQQRGKGKKTNVESCVDSNDALVRDDVRPSHKRFQDILMPVSIILKQQLAALKQREKDLVELKERAHDHLAALAAEARRTFENQTHAEITRLDQEIETISFQLRKRSDELSAFHKAWHHQDD